MPTRFRFQSIEQRRTFIILNLIIYCASSSFQAIEIYLMISVGIWYKCFKDLFFLSNSFKTVTGEDVTQEELGGAKVHTSKSGMWP